MEKSIVDSIFEGVLGGADYFYVPEGKTSKSANRHARKYHGRFSQYSGAYIQEAVAWENYERNEYNKDCAKKDIQKLLDPSDITGEYYRFINEYQKRSRKYYQPIYRRIGTGTKVHVQRGKCSIAKEVPRMAPLMRIEANQIRNKRKRRIAKAIRNRKFHA